MKPPSDKDDHCGGMSKIVLKRDGYRCLHCGMTNAEHKRRWKKNLTIDHIDKNGSTKPSRLRNNALRNLQTLCLQCHIKKDLSVPVVQLDKRLKPVRIFESGCEAGRQLRISHANISRAINHLGKFGGLLKAGGFH